MSRSVRARGPICRAGEREVSGCGPPGHSSRPQGRGELVGEYLAWIQDAVRVERGLDALHQGDRISRQLDVDVGRLGEPNAVFATDGALQRDDAFEQDTFSLLRSFALRPVRSIDHEIDVDIAIAGMAERRDPELLLISELLNDVELIRLPAPRDDDVVVDLEEARCPQ